jgi:hypothetical protein
VAVDEAGTGVAGVGAGDDGSEVDAGGLGAGSNGLGAGVDGLGAGADGLGADADALGAAVDGFGAGVAGPGWAETGEADRATSQNAENQRNGRRIKCIGWNRNRLGSLPRTPARMEAREIVRDFGGGFEEARLPSAFGDPVEPPLFPARCAPCTQLSPPIEISRQHEHTPERSSIFVSCEWEAR